MRIPTSVRLMSCVMLMFCTAWLVAGCAPRGVIQASAIDGTLRPVLDRHDRYVMADTTLQPVEQSTYLRSSALLRATLDEAAKTTTTATSKPAGSPAPIAPATGRVSR